MSDLVTKMTSNVNVGMDEVVSVFVSRYENNLFNKKDELSDKIKVLKREKEDQEKRLEQSVDTSKYETKNEVLNISSSVDRVTVDWEDRSIHVRVEVKDNDQKRDYYGSNKFTKTMIIELDDEEVTTHKKLEDELEGLNGELMEVMTLIKSVSRKERQIRGKISEMKLKESGFESLLESDEMVKLIKLD